MSTPERCQTHRNEGPDGYLAWHEWAEKKRGEQRQCPTCRLWFWRAGFGKGWAQGIRSTNDGAAS